MANQIVANDSQLKLGDLHFGKRDAIEETESSLESLDFFISSFYILPDIDTADYVSGEKCFIRGRKGTGKSALLQYIAQHSLNPETEGYRLILFTRIPGTEKTKLIRGTHVVDQPGLPTDALDVSYAWQLFIHRELALLLQDRPELVVASESLKQYIQNSSSIFERGGAGTAQVKSFFSRIAQGSFEIPAIFRLGLQLNPSSQSDTGRIELSKLVQNRDKLLTSIELRPKARLFLLLDELNPSSDSPDLQAKDYILIRELVIAVYEFNRTLRKKLKGTVRVLCAVRSEVMQLVDTSGAEIGKKLRGNGDEITWRRRNPNDAFEKAPIIRLVKEKIKAAEKRKFNRARRDEEIWSTYFAEKIFRLDPQRYIYQNTWARPRDLVLLLQMAADKSKTAEKFSERVFDRVQHDTQDEFWGERVEEMRLSYTKAEIGAIERCLTNFLREFSVGQFEQHARTLSGMDKEVKALIEKHDIQPILQHLYAAGVLGNVGEREYWEYEFDSLPKFNNNFIVHRGLIMRLNLVKK